MLSLTFWSLLTSSRHDESDKNDENKTTLCVFLVAVVVPLVPISGTLREQSKFELRQVGMDFATHFSILWMWDYLQPPFFPDTTLFSGMSILPHENVQRLRFSLRDIISHSLKIEQNRWEKRAVFRRLLIERNHGLLCGLKKIPPLTNPLKSTRRENSSWMYSNFSPSNYGEISQKCNEY